MGGGPPGFRPGFTCPVLLWIHSASCQFRLRDFYPLRSAFPNMFDYRHRLPDECPQPRQQAAGLASFPFARRYLGNRCFFLFLRVLRCFSSPRCLLYAYLFSIGYLLITAGGFPHSDICGSPDICSSPQLFAACHVLLRLPVPRHPPCALLRLTFLVNSLCESASSLLVSRFKIVVSLVRSLSTSP